MQIVHSARASAILYGYLARLADARPWLLPVNICPIVPITFLKARVPFRFVDITAESLHIDLMQVEELVRTGKYGGLLYAHTYGEQTTPYEFFALIKGLDPNLHIVDDRCLCVPDLQPYLDSSVDVSLFSTGYAKVVELNYGGYAFIRNAGYEPVSLPYDHHNREILEQAYKLAVQSRTLFQYRESNWLETDRSMPEWGEYCTQIELALEPALEQRKNLNQIYTDTLPGEVQLPAAYQSWRFNICVKNKEVILRALFDAGLFASSHYASLAGILGEGSAAQAEALASEVLNLFNDHHFDREKAEQVCSVILENL